MFVCIYLYTCPFSLNVNSSDIQSAVHFRSQQEHIPVKFCKGPEIHCKCELIIQKREQQ